MVTLMQGGGAQRLSGGCSASWRKMMMRGGEWNGRDDSGECTGMIGERNAAVADVVVEEQNDEDTFMEPH